MPYTNGVGKYAHTQNTPTKRYLVPNIPQDKPQRTAAIANLATGVAKSVRSSDGVKYHGAQYRTINIREDILAQFEVDGLHTVEVVIKYKSHEVTYTASIATLRTHGERVLADGWQIALPYYHWLVDGQAQTQPQSITTPQPPQQPEAMQAALFDMPVERQLGAY